MKKIYKVTGMSCSVCAGHVEKAARSVEGVVSADVNLTANTVKISWDENVCDVKDISKAIEASGYGLVTEEAWEKGKADKTLVRQRTGLITSVILLVLLVYVSMAHMFKLPLPDAVGHGTMTNAVLQLVLCVPVVVINFRFFKRGFPLLFKGRPNMDTLIAIGSSCAFLYSIYSVVAGGEHHSLYFETAAMILTFVSVGKFLETRAKSKTGTALEKLNSLVPSEAELVLEDGTVMTVPSADLKPGDVISVREGVLIPADGEVVEGGGTVDESGLTGESIPSEKGKGDAVKMGTLNVEGVFRMRVINAGSDTVISKTVALVQDAAATKAPIARLADRVSLVFVPVVIAIALVTGIVWFFITKEFETALKTCVTVLVVSCPCSLGLATPVAVTAAIYKSAENGILVRSAEVFEQLEKADTVVLDKTGTVTEGKPSVCGVMSFSSLGEDDIIRISSQIEAASNHPFAEAFLKEAEKRGIAAVPAKDYENIPGKGICGVADGEKYYIGNMRLVLDVIGDNVSPKVLDAAEAEAVKGRTPLFLMSNTEFKGFTLVADTIKAETKDAVTELRKLGKRVVMLTGDNERTASAIAAIAGIDEFKASVFPHEKEAYVRSLTEKGHRVIMVGDGINDSAALAGAAVGVAMGSGTDIAIESADCVLLKDSPSDIITLLDTSKFALRIIKQNLFWALFYNCVCIPIAAGVLVPVGISFSPMFASAAMSMSSLFVVMNALRIMRLRSKEAKRREESTMKYELTVEGMMCVRCKAHVEKALAEVQGVKSVSVDLDSKTAVCECDGNVNAEQLRKAVEDGGYEVISIK